MFTRHEFIEMATVPGRIRGKFILSLNAVQELFETFSKFQIDQVDCSYSVGGGGDGKNVRELIISRA